MKKFSKYIEEMSMSVTLKPKKNNMYKVTGVGKKMAAHGGIKKGEKFHDSEIDGMHDSGIKVKYDKPKPSMKKESSDSMQRMADTWNDHADHKDPKVQKHIKKAEKAYNDKDHEGFYNHTQRAADHAYALKSKQKNEAIERRMDRKTIIATDPATGRKVVKVAPKKEIDIGKGKHESVEEGKYNKYISLPSTNSDKYKANMKKTADEIKNRTGHARNFVKPKPGGGSFTDANGVKTMSKGKVNEISDTTKLSYINKANKAITDREKLHLKIGAKVDKDKTLEKMRKGVTMAKSKLGEDMTPMQMYELKISTMQKYKQAARSDVQDGENARHKGYPEKDIDKRQDKRYKGIDTANKRIDKKQVKMAKGVAFDKRYKGGNMTGASKAIDKIKPGLSDHPKVKSALRRANEEIGE
jgi:hypothetical protein